MGGGGDKDTLDYLSPGFGYGGSGLVRDFDSSLRSGMGGGGGKGGGGNEFDRAQLPPGFRNNLTRFGKQTGAALTGPQMKDITGQTLDYYQNLQDSPYITETADALLRQVKDPTSLTDPLFLQQREQLGGELIERGRQIGGLGSSATTEVVGQGLGDFTNKYLADAYGRQIAAGSQLFNQRLGLGQAMFTPYQAYSQPYMALLGKNQQPQQFSNSKGQAYGAAGQIGASLIPVIASAASDETLKYDLRPVRFRWKDEALNVGKMPHSKDVGLLAQDVERIWPDAVERRGRYLYVNYPLVAARLAAIVKGQARQLRRSA